MFASFNLQLNESFHSNTVRVEVVVEVVGRAMGLLYERRVWCIKSVCVCVCAHSIVPVIVFGAELIVITALFSQSSSESVSSLCPPRFFCGCFFFFRLLGDLFRRRGGDYRN